MKAIIVAGTQSGVGKTTVALGLIRALRDRGLRVAPFKAGPDYIDPSHHAVAAGQASRNLDTWMLPPDVVRRSFAGARARSDIAVIEGVMGLFDGRNGEGDAGSTADLAKLLGVPVVLVIDAAAMARSAAAMVLGYQQFDPDLRFAGVILNNLGSETHLRMVRSAIEQRSPMAVLGGIYRDHGLALPERHLGLVPAGEYAAVEDVVSHAAAMVEEHVDLDALLARLPDIEVSEDIVALLPGAAAGPVPIAIARDEAFSFYYEDGLDLLRAAGAELLPFSPLRDQVPPPGARGIYIGGGFPELFAAELAANAPMRASLREGAANGVPVYAECGGHMYLGQSLTSTDGATHAMVGATPVTSTVEKTKLTLGYRVARALRDGPVFAIGERVRAHEFHMATSTHLDPASTCWEVENPALGPAGFSTQSIWSSYLHVHFGAAPGAALRFVRSCAGERK